MCRDFRQLSLSQMPGLTLGTLISFPPALVFWQKMGQDGGNGVYWLLASVLWGLMFVKMFVILCEEVQVCFWLALLLHNPLCRGKVGSVVWVSALPNLVTVGFFENQIPRAFKCISSWPSISEPTEKRSVWGCMQLPSGSREGFSLVLCFKWKWCLLAREVTKKCCVPCSLQRGLWHCLELSNQNMDGIYDCKWCALFPPQCAQQEGSTSASGFCPWAASLGGLWRLSLIITVFDCKRQSSTPDKVTGGLGMVEKQLAGLTGFFK